MYILNLCIFCPPIIDKYSYKKLLEVYGKETVDIVTPNGYIIHGMLVNNYKKESYSDKIFLYSHGNACSMIEIFNTYTINFLSQFGSVFIYDYNGYGINNNTPSEEQCYNDITSVWRYLIEEKNIKPENIVVYGHSLGCSFSSKLVSNLCNDNKKLPKALILESPFSNMSDMCHHAYSGLGYLVCGFDNVENLKNIDGRLPVLVMHSKDDRVIPFEQSQKIKRECKCDFLEIFGGHSSPIYNIEVVQYIDKLIN